MSKSILANTVLLSNRPLDVNYSKQIDYDNQLSKETDNLKRSRNNIHIITSKLKEAIDRCNELETYKSK